MRIAKRFFIFLPPLFFSLCSYSQHCDSIPWSPHHQLKWRYFKGTPDKTVSANAVSEPHIYFHYRAVSNLANFRFACTFSTCHSWVRIATSQSLLVHEQLHFDIAEYYKRLLVKEILSQYFTQANIEEKVNAIWGLISRLSKDTNELYDLDTNHSTIEEKQKEWGKKVRKMLKSVDDYDKDTYIIALH
jgi:hypothetical protein